MAGKIHRRTMLRGMGACLSLPLLDVMASSSRAASRRNAELSPLEQSTRVTPRIIYCYVPNGVNILEWIPERTGQDYELSKTLTVLEPFRDQFSVISGLGHPHSKGGHSGADTWLTGADLASVPGKDYSNTVSIDQLIAEKLEKETRFASLQLSDQAGTGNAFHSYTLSFDKTGTPVPAEESPRRLFERLFVPDSAKDRKATLQRYAAKKSILDSVLDDANRLGRQLPKSDQQKLEQYLNSVRQTEQRVERLESWIDVPKPEIQKEGLRLNSRPRNRQDRSQWIEVMLDLSYLAFATDTTRVISYEWSREAGGFGGSGENHHELSHHGGDETMLQKLGEIDRFHLSKLKRFMELLQSTTDGEGQMLDNTIIVYGSGMNSGEGGEHSPDNLPLLVAGGKRLGLKHGQHLAFDPKDHPPLSNLHLELARKMGLELDSFSDANGSLKGLT